MKEVNILWFRSRMYSEDDYILGVFDDDSMELAEKIIETAVYADKLEFPNRPVRYQQNPDCYFFETTTYFSKEHAEDVLGD